MEKFTRETMFDDGAHGDSIAGDGIFGMNLTVNSPEIQYYFYAENNNAGIFLPQRAENEYYTLAANYTSINTGQVVINEIMAVNNSTVQNSNGLFGDWVELYNNGSSDIVVKSNKDSLPLKVSGELVLIILICSIAAAKLLVK